MSDILTAGDTCWTLARADRAKVLIDGATYFSALRDVLLKAERTIDIVGWDFHSQIELVPFHPDLPGPAKLGDFLVWLAERNRRLRIRVLLWDFAAFFAGDREVPPLFAKAWRTHPRVRFRFDDRHPPGACHHEKIVVIDDRIAFLGGIDLTQWRWDSSDHAPQSAGRIDPSGDSYRPVHDMQWMVDGPVARSIGSHVRERWHRLLRRRFAMRRRSSRLGELWPDGYEPDFRNVQAGIARTVPHRIAQRDVREVEQLHLAAIKAAKSCIYIENQYFTSVRAAAAIAERLAEPDGPEVVIILPDQQRGWLEEMTMGASRLRLLRQLIEADAHHHLLVVRPVTVEGGQIDVHAKLLIIDDQMIRIGSSNLSNRSMGLDTECDLAIEPSRPEDRLTVASLRNRLIAEHLATTEARVAEEIARTGSVLQAIDILTGEGMHLKPIVIDPQPGLVESLPLQPLYDPEQPLEAARLIQYLGRDPDFRAARRALPKLLPVVFGAILLFALWTLTPLRHVIDRDHLLQLGQAIRAEPLAPLYVILFYVASGFLVMPVTVLVAATVVLFRGPEGLLIAVAGMMASAAMFFTIGRVVGTRLLDRIGSKRLDRLRRKLAGRGIVTVALVRAVPIAPFTVVNLIAGAAQMRPRDFFLGSLLGLTPGIVGFGVIGEGVARLWEQPGADGVLWLGIGIAAVVAIGWGVRRWLTRSGTTSTPALDPSRLDRTG